MAKKTAGNDDHWRNTNSTRQTHKEILTFVWLSSRIHIVSHEYTQPNK